MKGRFSICLLALLSSAYLLLLDHISSIYAQTDERGVRVQDAQQTEQRVALVIGNSAYKDSLLLNPVNDARAMARTLRDLGFEVIQGENLSQIDMKRLIRLFGDKIRGGIGLFYYAGHGIQLNGRNYLIPVNATITKEQETEYESVDLGFLLAQMDDARNRLNIVILDACRNNPFARSFRSAKSGLASTDAPSGTLIAYATAPGSVASDGTGENGLYTQELLKYMRMPELSIEQVFKRVRIAVREQTKGTQTPWESSSLVGDFYFAGKTPAASSGLQLAQPAMAETYIQKGDSLADQNKWAEAEVAYRLALDWEPDNAWCRFKLYTALSLQNKVDQFIAERRKIHLQKKWGEIEARTRQLVEHNPTSALAHWGFGAALSNQQEYTKAETAFRKAVSLEPDDARWHASLANALWGQQKHAEAEAEYRKAISLDPDNAKWHGDLAYALSNQRKYTEAEAEYRKAISLDPNTATWHGYLGITLGEQKKYTEAEEELRKAISLGHPDEKLFQQHLDTLMKKKQ